MNLKPIIDKVLAKGISSCDNILELQVALKLLGFMPRNYTKQCDGIRGKTTALAVKAFQAHKGLSRGVYDITEDINQCLLNNDWFKVPYTENPKEENLSIQKLLDEHSQEIIREYNIPYSFLKAILWQETGLQHYDTDGFVFIGCDFGVSDTEKYKSRGWGIGQYTIKNHPPTKEQFENLVDPYKNIVYSINILKEKFRLYTKNIPCKYNISDVKYMDDCYHCLDKSPKCDVVYPEARYHPKSQRGYKNIPLLSGCGWGTAVMRYNGGGQNAMAYRDEVLMKILGQEIR